MLATYRNTHVLQLAAAIRPYHLLCVDMGTHQRRNDVRA